MKQHGYTREKIVEMLQDACDYELLKKVKGKNNGIRYDMPINKQNKEAKAYEKYSAHSGSISIKQPTTTASQCRIPIFLPVKQLPQGKKGQDIIIDTQWGTVTFKGAKLTQVHRNILDCIFTYHKMKHEYPDSSVGFLVSLREIQKKLGVSHTNHKWLVQKLEELRATPMKIKSKNNEWTIHTGIIRKLKYSQIQREDNYKNTPLYGSGHFFGVIFESEYMQIFKDDLNIHTEQLTESIISLKSAFLQAIVRFCLSHRAVNMKIEDVMKAIGANNKSDRHTRRQKEELQQYKDLLQEKFGISITDTHIFYRQHPQIWFENTPKTDMRTLVSMHIYIKHKQGSCCFSRL